MSFRRSFMAAAGKEEEYRRQRIEKLAGMV